MLLVPVFVLTSLFSTTRAGLDMSVHPLLSSYQWQNRLLLIFSPEGEDEAYTLQLKELMAKERGLQERDLLLFHVFNDRVLMPNEAYLGKAEAQSLRKHFIIPDKETVTLLLGKDGTEKLRSRELLTTQRLFMTIDAMPMRQEELKNTKAKQDRAGQ